MRYIKRYTQLNKLKFNNEVREKQKLNIIILHCALYNILFKTTLYTLRQYEKLIDKGNKVKLYKKNSLE